MPTSGRREPSTGEPPPVFGSVRGRNARLSAGGTPADRRDLEALSDQAGGSSASPVGRAGDLGLDLQGSGGGGGADPGACSRARRWSADLLHDVQPAACRE